MEALLVLAVLIFLVSIAFLAWRRYVSIVDRKAVAEKDKCPYSLTDEFGNQHLLNIPHQQGVEWLGDVFIRSAKKYPNLIALQIPHSGESLTFSELDQKANVIASAISGMLEGPDQVVAVSMSQDNPEVIACHLGILRAGGVMMFLDPALPDALVSHMLEDSQPVAILTRGETDFRGRPSIDVLSLPTVGSTYTQPAWLDNPAQRLATIFYTSGTTGRPKGVECHHAGYVNLALTYADYFDLAAGMDATTLTSSLGYDGSISEMYSAWVSGCSVVLITKEQMRSGPDLVSVLCDAEVTMLFCPPVLLTTLTPEPEFDLPYPVCRYIVPAGEAFPNALVEPWTRGRRQIINTYGPTEASTDTSRVSLRPGEEVTIGTPFANVKYVILDIGDLKPVQHGQTGELCIGGVHVARGYRNLPELTEQKFIEHPEFGRLYRTGDKCRIDIETQRVHFLGRVDTQLKVRGHRVEIQPVEDLLHTQFEEIETAVVDYQNQELVAFVKAPSLESPAFSAFAPAPTKWSAKVKKLMAEQLAEASVPTRIFLVENFVIKPVSGKIDRDQLPKLAEVTSAGAPVSIDMLVSDIERPIESKEKPPPLENGEAEAGHQVLAICRKAFGNAFGWDDTFAENGGHSIVIAQLAQQLHSAGWPISVRSLLSDVNTPRKILAWTINNEREYENQLTTPVKAKLDEPDEYAATVLRAGHFSLLQGIFLLVLYAPALAIFLVVVAFGDFSELFLEAGLAAFIVIGVLTYLFALLFPFFALLWVFAIKMFLSGHPSRNYIKPGVYPKWSRMHLRVWCIDRLQASVIAPLGAMFRSTTLMAFVMRQLGATVGKESHCAHDVEFFGPLDLLSVDDCVTAQSAAYIQMTQWIDSKLHIGRIHLERNVKIGMRAGIACNVVIRSGTWITPFTSMLTDTGRNEMWEGSPAKLAGRYKSLDRPSNNFRPHQPLWQLETVNISLQIVMECLLLVLPTATITWVVACLIPRREIQDGGEYFSSTSLPDTIWQLGIYTFVTTWLTILVISIFACLFIRFTAEVPGVYASRGFKGSLHLYRIRKMNQVQQLWTWTIFGQYLRSLAGMRFEETGASECDYMRNLVPELSSSNALVFWSHGCLTNMLDQGGDHMIMRQLDMPANFFASNNCVAEGGHFRSNLLLGVSTPGSDINFRRQMQTIDEKPLTVAGNPPVQFASTGPIANLSSQRRPTFFLFLARIILNDIISIGFLRSAEVLTYAVLYICMLRYGLHILASAFLALLLTEACLVSACLVIKKLLVGNRWGSGHSTPFWSLRHFTYFFAQDCFFSWCRTPMTMFTGTVFPNFILRKMGCRIGNRTIIIDPLQVADWNAVDFGDDCTVGGLLQLHSFEDMNLKIKRTELRSGCSVNFGTTLMGGAVIGQDVTILPLTLVTKEMQLSSGTYWGSPAETAPRSQVSEVQD